MVDEKTDNDRKVKDEKTTWNRTKMNGMKIEDETMDAKIVQGGGKMEDQVKTTD